jgi:hypothetical protein
MSSSDEMVRGLARQVADQLGWSVDGDWDCYGAVIASGDMGLHLHEPHGRAGYVSVVGRYPPTSYHFRRGERDSIGVRADRGPHVIAREIRRRLLPAYVATLAAVAEHEAAEAADAAARSRFAEYVTGLFPPGAASMPGHCQSKTRTEILVRGRGNDVSGGWVKSWGDGRTVSLDMDRIPAAVALRMLEALALGWRTNG